MESVLEEIERFREDLRDQPDSQMTSDYVTKTLNFEIGEYSRFVENYNDLVDLRDLEDYTKMQTFSEQEDVSPSAARGGLDSMKRNLFMATNVLEKLENKSVETDKVARLSSLKSSVNTKLNSEYPVLSRNLKQAINSLEDGHSKPAAITASGVVDHVMSIAVRT